MTNNQEMPADSDHFLVNHDSKTSAARVESVPERITISLRNAYVWVKSNPVATLLLLTITGTLVYFFGFVPLFIKGIFIRRHDISCRLGLAEPGTRERTRNIRSWCHFISLGLVWYHRKKIKEAPRSMAPTWDWSFVGIGTRFVLAERALSSADGLRFASVPFLDLRLGSLHLG